VLSVQSKKKYNFSIQRHRNT